MHTCVGVPAAPLGPECLQCLTRCAHVECGFVFVVGDCARGMLASGGCFSTTCRNRVVSAQVRASWGEVAGCLGFWLCVARLFAAHSWNAAVQHYVQEASALLGSWVQWTKVVWLGLNHQDAYIA